MRLVKFVFFAFFAVFFVACATKTRERIYGDSYRTHYTQFVLSYLEQNNAFDIAEQELVLLYTQKRPGPGVYAHFWAFVFRSWR